jgi:hypothetical protein
MVQLAEANVNTSGRLNCKVSAAQTSTVIEATNLTAITTTMQPPAEKPQQSTPLIPIITVAVVVAYIAVIAILVTRKK